MLKSPSLFLKLTLFAVGAMVTSLAFIGIFTHYFLDHSKEYFAHGARSLSHVISHELRTNPTPQRLAELAEQSDLDMRYDDGLQQFITDDSMPTFQALEGYSEYRRQWVRRLPSSMRVLQDDEHELYLYFKKDNKKVAVELDKHFENSGTIFALLLFLIIALVVVWLIVYFLIRWQLRPLNVLRQDMEKIGHGQWIPLQVSRDDEIGLLAKGFNRMQDRLKSEIEARERFLRDASHELRTPLTRLKLRAEMINDTGLQEKFNNDINQIENLTRDILQNTRLRADGATAAKARIVLKDFFTMLIQSRLSSEQQCIELECADSLVVLGVEKSLAIAINNLIDNSLKYATRVSIIAKIKKTDPHEKTPMVQIQIVDDGEGVADADLPHLFQPFYRADVSRTRQSGGFGLGLAIAATAIESQNGTIHASNHSDGGLQINIDLPQAV